MPPLRAINPNEDILIPKLRMQFAEFLNHGSLIHLSILYLPTCVGLGYGRYESSLADFLGSRGSTTSSYSTRHRVSAFVGSGFTYAPAYALTPESINRVRLPSYVPALLAAPLWVHSSRSPKGPGILLATMVKPGRAHSGTGISTSCPSTTPFGLVLGPDSPWEE